MAEEPGSKPPENWRQRLGWLVADRVALGVVVALIAFGFNAYLQREQRVGDYQRLLFEKRVKAYEELSAAAKSARDRCALAHRIFLAARPATKAADITWQTRLSAAAADLWVLDADEGDGGGGAGDVGSSAGHGDSGSGIRKPAQASALSKWEVEAIRNAVKALEDLERIRTASALYISDGVHGKIDKLLETLVADIETLQSRAGKKQRRFASSMSEADRRFVEDAYSRAEASYDVLLRAIGEALRLRELILG